MRTEEESQWISIADIMSGMMVIFLFIAVAYMGRAQEKTKGYLDLKGDLFRELNKEFHADLESWNAEIDKDSLTIRFRALDTLFDNGSPNPRPEFRTIISNFFPRYSRILFAAKYRDQIEEIRIEGHTSSDGESPNQAIEFRYSYNLRLSQDRSRNVLTYSLSQVDGKNDGPLKDWLRANLTANGLSFSKLIFRADAPRIEDKERSRRVEFRVRLKADKTIEDCLQKLSYKRFNASFGSARDKIVSEFNIVDFYKQYDKGFYEVPHFTDQNAKEDKYSEDWHRISAEIRYARNWTCEECNLNLIADKKYLHVHHRNFIRSDNSPSNLHVLCIGCHSFQDNHIHIRGLRDFAPFIKKYVYDRNEVLNRRRGRGTNR